MVAGEVAARRSCYSLILRPGYRSPQGQGLDVQDIYSGTPCPTLGTHRKAATAQWAGPSWSL